jgi:tape measure domain-containing protein
MASIDDKIVAMSFESGRFRTGIGIALMGLEKLRAALNMKGAGKGLQDINAAAQKVDMSHIGSTLDALRAKASAMSVAMLAVLSNIAIKATHAGAEFAKSFTFAPIMQGFKEYELGLNSVQTILANTSAAGVNLKDVNKALDELNEYADQTIYNFGQMARNVGTFTAAGVELDVAVGAIKGISNLAALSGSNAEQASRAMYQLSQALSTGKVALRDWMSIETAGMGGSVFQRALAETAVKVGTLSEGAVTLSGKMKNVTINGEKFRNTLTAAPGEESWLTTEVLTKTLEQLTGDLTDADLAARGYTKSQIKAIQAQAKLALGAATQVKTFTQLVSTTKEAIGSGWAKTFQLLLGDFGEAKKLFTGLSNAISGFVSRSADARNKVLKDWKALGGRKLLIDSLKNAFEALTAIVTPIKDAFRDIFPRKTGQDLFTLTQRFHAFTEKLKPGKETIENLRRTFRGLFALLDIGKMIIGGIFSVIGRLFGALSSGNGGFLQLTGSIGDFIVSIRDALKSGDGIGRFFDGLGKILAMPIKLISTLAGALGGLFGAKASEGISDTIGGIGTALSPIERSITGITKAWDNFINSFGSSEGKMTGFGDAITNIFTSLGEGISNINWDLVLAGINTGLFAGLIYMFKNFFGKGSILSQIGGAKGVLGNISGAFKGLEGAAVGLQQNIKAKTLKEIAIAVGILAVSIFLLSTIEPKKLQNAMIALTAAFGLLIGALALLDAATKMAVVSRLPIIGGALILLASAMVILSLAVKILSTMSWEELAKGLGGITALLIVLTAVAGPLGQSSAGLVRAGVGIAAIGVAMNILAMAIKAFGSLSWTELGKGMLGVATSLVVIGGAARLFPPNMVAIGAGLVLVGAGLKIIADVVTQLGLLSLKTLGKGLGAIALALVGIAGAMHIMPKGMLLQAAALLAIGAALNLIAKAVGIMGGMSLEEIGKGLGTLAGSLVILAGGLALMQGAMGGAITLSVAATGIALLVPALKILGGMSWGSIIKGLVTLGAALGVIGIASLLLTPAIPAMLGLGAALILIGGGLALAGAGIALIGIGLSAIAVAGPAAVAILVGALTSLMEKLPIFVEDLIKALLSIVTGLAEAAPKFVAAIVKIIGILAIGIIKAMPSIITAISAIVQGILKVLVTHTPRIVAAGLSMLMSLLLGIERAIPQLTAVVVRIIAAFLTSLGNGAGQIVAGGLNLIVGVVKGIAKGIGKVITAGADIIIKFVSGLGKNAAKIVTAAGKAITEYIKAIGKSAKNIIKAGADLILDFVTGLGKNGKDILKAATTAITGFIAGLGSMALEIGKAGAEALIDFLEGIETALKEEDYIQRIMAAGIGIGAAIVQGFIDGLAAEGHRILTYIKDKILGPLPWAVKKFLGIDSPSKMFVGFGKNVVQGFINGLVSSPTGVVKAAGDISNGVIDTTKDIFDISSPSGVMKQLGRWVVKGFADGITGSVESVTVALGTMNSKLINTVNYYKDLIDEHEKTRDKLKAAKEKDLKAIAEEEKDIKKYQKLLTTASAVHTEFAKGLTKQRAELFKLAKEFDRLTIAVEKHKNELEEAIQIRDSASKSFSEQFGETPEFDFGDVETPNADPLGTYMKDLGDTTAAVTKYGETLAALDALGLNDITYKKLVDEGPAAQQFASQLLLGGQAAVTALNVLDEQLKVASTTFGATASTNLYQAGVNLAESAIAGALSRKGEIIKRMDELADIIVKSLKKKLKIKSPSEVLKEVGVFAIQGLANGLTASSKLVTTAAENVGSTAIDAMKKSMSGLSAALTSEINAQPMITPVLDLSQVRQDARSMADILNKVPITADASYGLASAISTEQTAAEIEKTALAAVPAISFEQNNYSPEALPAIEIYRRTRNQLAQAQLAMA